MLPAIILILVSTLLSTLLTGAVRRFVMYQGVIDHPNERSSHAVPTPRGGGLGVVAAALIAIAIAALAGWIDGMDALTFGAGTAILAFLGWLDDRSSLRALPRLAVHTLVAVSTVYLLGGLPTVRLGETTFTLGVVGYIVATLGIVWSINLFNFMDGIDGIAGSQAMVVFGATGVMLLTAGQMSLACLALILCGASAGFLFWNWPPAKIFLGDVGSLPLGFLLAAIAVAAENRSSVPLIAIFIAGSAFIADATITLTRRLLRGIAPVQAHREHAYQRLSRYLGGHRPVTLAVIGLTTLLSALGAAGAVNAALMVPAAIIAGVLLAVIMLLVERLAPMSRPPVTPAERPGESLHPQ